MASSDEDCSDPFAAIREPFAGLNEQDYEVHGIYMDHEPDDEYLSSVSKCKDTFLNILVSDANLRSASMTDELRANLGTDLGSDEENEEEVERTYKIHDPSTKWHKMVPKVGDIFENPTQLKTCIINYAVSNGYQLYLDKCDSTRIVAKCGIRGGENICPFRLNASWMYTEKSFQIKTLVYEYECVREFKKFGIVSPEWIGRHMMSKIANTPKIKLNEMIEEVRQKLRCEVSIGQCRRAKEWAKDLIEGNLSEHYAKIRDYTNELLRSNPGSTCKVGVTINEDGKNYLHRFDICFKALSDGWKRGCRRVIGLDGCFLKGRVKCELLTAI